MNDTTEIIVFFTLAVFGSILTCIMGFAAGIMVQSRLFPDPRSSIARTLIAHTAPSTESKRTMRQMEEAQKPPRRPTATTPPPDEKPPPPPPKLRTRPSSVKKERPHTRPSRVAPDGAFSNIDLTNMLNDDTVHPEDLQVESVAATPPSSASPTLPRKKPKRPSRKPIAAPQPPAHLTDFNAMSEHFYADSYANEQEYA